MLMTLVGIQKTTPLFLAIKKQFKVAQQLINKGANINAISNKVQPLTQIAKIIYKEKTTEEMSGLFNFLLESGATISNAVHRYVYSERLNEKKKNKNVLDIFNNPNINIEDKIKAIKANEFNVNQPDENHKTLLIKAQEIGDIEMIRCLLELGAAVESQTIDEPNEIDKIVEFNSSALLNAIKEEQWEIAKLLITFGANVNFNNQIDTDNQTVLQLAVNKKNHEIVKLLLDHGADVNKAIKIERSNAMQMGYNEKHLSNGHEPALISAIKNNSSEIINTLLAASDIKIDLPDMYEKTPLMWAIEKGNTQIINSLLEKGADVNHSNIYGNSALITICKQSPINMDALKAILAKNPDVNLKNKEGKTALSYALEKIR